MKNFGYLELKNKQQKELNEFEGVFYAFSKKQLLEGLKKLGLTEKDKDRIVSFGSGGFILKDRLEDFKAMLKRFEEERKQARKSDQYLYEMFLYELANHEFCITYDYDDTLEALGLTYEEVKKDKRLYNALMKAKKDYLAKCEC